MSDEQSEHHPSLTSDRISTGIKEYHTGLTSRAKKRHEREFSTVEHYEEFIKLMAIRYDAVFANRPLNREDDIYDKDSDYSFIEAMRKMCAEIKVSPVEVRLIRSDLLSMYYLLVGNGLDTLFNKYYEKNLAHLSDEEIAEYDQEKVQNIEAELAHEFIVEQRRKNKENEFLQKNPDAPTIGFEFEYTDAIREMIFTYKRASRKVDILSALVSQDQAQLRELVKSPKDLEFIAEVEKRVKQEEIAHEEILEQYEGQLEGLKPLFKFQSFYEQAPEETDEQRSMILEEAKSVAVQTIESLEKLPEGLLPEKDKLEKLRVLRRQIDIFDSKIVFARDDDLEPSDIEGMLKIVPTKLGRMSLFGPFKDVKELDASREYVSSPSVSPKMQLRDFIKAKLAGAIEGSLTIHQTIGGVELKPGRTDFMEVRALLAAAEYLPHEELDAEDVEEIRKGLSVYNEAYRKVSLVNGSEYYYFPYHRSRTVGDPSNVGYPTPELRNLVEMRSFSRLQEDAKYFPKLVREVTFSWLAGWGEQAQNKRLQDRNVQESKLAEAFENLLENWSELLESNNINQPEEHQRYLKLENDYRTWQADIDKNLLKNENYYSIYLDQLQLKAEEDKSFRTQARSLITEYNKTVKSIIGY